MALWSGQTASINGCLSEWGHKRKCLILKDLRGGPHKRLILNDLRVKKKKFGKRTFFSSFFRA